MWPVKSSSSSNLEHTCELKDNLHSDNLWLISSYIFFLSLPSIFVFVFQIHCCWFCDAKSAHISIQNHLSQMLTSKEKKRTIKETNEQIKSLCVAKSSEFQEINCSFNSIGVITFLQKPQGKVNNLFKIEANEMRVSKQ